MSKKNTPPLTAAELRQAILDRYDRLSGRLQQVARHVLDHPDEFALETLAVIAERTGTQPSTIVRFAKTFGFDGASEIQRLCRDVLVSRNVALDYGERVRRFKSGLEDHQQTDSGEILREFVEASNLALSNLPQTVGTGVLDEAIRLIADASSVYVIGMRRSFPVAAYLAYALQQSGKRTLFIDGVGGLGKQQIQTIAPEDLLIAISYHPYASETVEIVELAAARESRILAFSDSAVSPIAKLATCILVVKETDVRSFRTLSASLCLAQALVIDLALTQATASSPKRTHSKSGNLRQKKV
jgi:DNA-binding MurR/RpiR family transcriptional regulator